MGRKQINLSEFGIYLEGNKATRVQVATGLDITQSYVSMLCRGSATPGLKLAIEIARWTKVTFGGEGFGVEKWA